MNSRILVVDDVPQNIQVVGTILRQAGYHVMPAASGAQALDRVQAQAPDLILLDLMMPEMDGLEVCQRLKADAALARIPVVFLTASNEMEHLVRGFSAGAVDYITKPFNAPELLARVRTHLELRAARERLREMNEEKNEFMGIVAHDLRNPLGAIQGYAEMLLEEPRPAPEEVHDTAQRIREAARRMAEMVRDFLDANAIEGGEFRPDLQPLDLAELARRVVEGFQARAAAKDQHLGFHAEPGPAPARIDRDLMVQILENLVSNAVKYSPTGKAIEVRVERTPEGIRCAVKDEGPGLGAEDRKRLFGRFARLSARPTGGEQSTGLGLSIVKRLVESMHGRVWCDSEPGHGATFVVLMPEAPGVGSSL